MSEMSEMKYVSTRGDKTEYSAAEAIIKGLADDGGLFVPKEFPELYFDLSEMERLSALSYQELALEVMRVFFPEFSEDELKACIAEAYNERFDDAHIAPLVKSGGVYFLELFHGRTLAFKDMALSILPGLMKLSAKKTKLEKKILILTATSGDTGKAAMEGFKDIEGVSVMVFYPKDGVSKVQELQMTTQEGANVQAIAVEGNFDDCQSAVKSVFSDTALAEEFAQKGILLSSANSINIGRLIPQVVYYFYGYFQLISDGQAALGDAMNICVPTGNFGNILAAYFAKKMGLPVNKLICASNENKVLFDFFETGEYDKNRDLKVTNSPSMDILISSNLERFLYMVSGESTASLMEQLAKTGKFQFDKALFDAHGITGQYASQEESLSVIAELNEETGYIMDTHTAVAYFANQRYQAVSHDDTPAMLVATASPYKFARSVLCAIDAAYEKLDDFAALTALAEYQAEEVPEQIRDLNLKEVRHKEVCAKDNIKAVVRKQI